MNKALIVEDNRQVADSLAQMISFFDIPTDVTYGARSAMTILKDQTPSVVLLDLNLPGVTGFDVLGFLKREPRLAEVPVVVVTSDDQPESAQRAKDAGADAYIVKPVNMDVLEEVLKSVKVIS
ncbi:MAG: response regulator [Anaerolineales bacterium]|jgi:DNA-binding response OmpR family regulator